jgi:proton glutamate symport protein
MISPFRRLSLTHWILIAMVLGVLVGAFFPKPTTPPVPGEFSWTSQDLKVFSGLFLKMIKCILVPLVFGTLVVGIAGHTEDLKSVGKLALRSILYFEVVTTVALVIGLGVVNVTKPGVGLTLTGSASEVPAPKEVTWAGIADHLVPTSFFKAAADNDVLQVVFFALVFGTALAQVPRAQREPVLKFCESLTEAMFRFTGIVMKFAPIGIGAAMAVTVGHSGLAVLKNLAALIGTLYLGLGIFCVGVLLPVAWWARIPVLEFLRTVKEPAILAFTTTSSDAAMPDAMRRMVEFGVPRRIVSFVMPLGYSFNLDGSTLYLAVASVFVAQAAGRDLSLGQQISIVLTLMLTSKGMAGIPRASQVILAGVLVTYDLPLAGVAVIMGIDELMDMGRTTVNLVGNCLSTAVMARWEGCFRTGEAASGSGDETVS